VRPPVVASMVVVVVAAVAAVATVVVMDNSFTRALLLLGCSLMPRGPERGLDRLG
jgi:hypothetical protein